MRGYERSWRRLASVMLIATMLMGTLGCAHDTVSDAQGDAQSQADGSQAADGLQSEQKNADASSASDTDTSTAAQTDNGVHKTFTVDISKQFQTMEGFGAAYTWYGDRLLNARDSAAGLDKLFSEAKLTILRFKNEYGYHIQDKAENATAMARNFKEARDRAAEYGEDVKVLLCCWSPPAWLKSDATIDTGYGTLARHEDGTYMYEEYAQWWADSVEFYRSKGVRIDYVSIQNEVDYSPESYEGCRFDAKETASHAGYAEAFVAVYRAFRDRFGDDAPRMIGPETMSCNGGTLLSYVNQINNLEPDALYGLGYHLYVGGTSDTKTNTVKASSFMTSFNGIKDQFPEYSKWQTEFYIGRGIQTADLICYALTGANMTAYLYWSGVWDDSTPGRFESADLIEVNNQGVWRTSANYYAMRHFSEFIRPGYVRVDTKSQHVGVRSCAFTNSNGSKLAAVIVNNSADDIAYSFSIPDYTILSTDAYLSVFGEECKSEKDMYKSLGSIGSGSDVAVTVPAYSVLTVDITGYAYGVPVEVPAVQRISTSDTAETAAGQTAIPVQDKLILYKTFDVLKDKSAFSNMGSGLTMYVADGGEDGTGCIAVRSRAAEWNGVSLSPAYFDDYGYMLRVSYDCMMESDNRTVSCTSTFSKNSSTYYPEDNRVVCSDMEAGKWYHVDGYMKLYSDMDAETFRIYWESPDNKDDFYIDNVMVTLMYTQPVGAFEN